jgi:hypothetical protein
MLQLSTFRKNSGRVTEQLALRPDSVKQKAGVVSGRFEVRLEPLIRRGARSAGRAGQEGPFNPVICIYDLTKFGGDVVGDPRCSTHCAKNRSLRPWGWRDFFAERITWKLR